MNSKQLVEFYIISTPIGNLEDITLRALKTLKSLDLILVETKNIFYKLAKSYNLPNTKVMTYRESSHARVVNSLKKVINSHISSNKSIRIGLVSDAGTPLISDPGLKLLSELKQYYQDVIKIIPIPGVSAVTTAFSIFSSATSPRFLFMGFWPGRIYRGIKIINSMLEIIVKYKITIIFFVSKHDLKKILMQLQAYENDKLLKLDYKVNLGLAKELTKVHEQFVEGGTSQILEFLEVNKQAQNGEFTLLISLTK